MAESVAAPPSLKGLRITAYLSLPAFLIASIIVAIPLVMVALLQGRNPEEISILAALLLTVVAELMVIGLAVLVTRAYRAFRDIFGFKNFRWKTVGLGLAVGVLFLVGLQAIGTVANMLGAGVESSDTSVAIGSVTGPTRYLVLLFLVPVVVPLVEEIFFRGYVLGFLRRGFAVENEKLTHRKVLIAIAISSVFFSVAHFQGLSSIADAFIMVWVGIFAVALAVLRIKTDSLYPTYAAHLVYNLLTSVLLIFTLV